MTLPAIEQPITSQTQINFASVDERAELIRRFKTMRNERMIDELLNDLRTTRSLLRSYENAGGDLSVVAQTNTELLEREWDLLYHMSSKDMIALFNRDIGAVLDREAEDVFDDIAHVLLGELSLEDRDAVKKQLVHAIRNSQTRIGEEQIVLGGESTDPTVANWLRDVRNFTTGSDPDALQIVEYINGSQNAQALSEENTERLDTLLKLLADLEVSSTTNGSYEGGYVFPDLQAGEYMYYLNGRVISTGETIDEEELAELRKQYGMKEDGEFLSLAEQVRDAVEGRYELPPQLQEYVNTIEPAAEVAQIVEEQVPQAPDPVVSAKQDDVLAVDVLEDVPAPEEVEESAEEMAEELPPLVESPVQPVAEPISIPVQEEVPAPQEERFVPIIHVDESDSEPYKPEDSIVEATEPMETVVPVAPTPTPAPVAPMPIPKPPVVEQPVEIDTAPMPPAPQPQQSAPEPAREGVDYNDIAERVLAEFNILFDDYAQEKSFISIVASYLRGVRTYTEAYDALSRSPEEGGVDLTVEQIEDVLDEADVSLKEEMAMPQAKRQATKKTSGSGPRPTLAMVQEKIAEQRAKEKEEWSAVPVLKRDVEEGGVEDIFSNIGGAANDTEMYVQPVPVVEQAQEEPELPVGDISKEALPTVMGPLEELKHMTLTEYRQFGSNPIENTKQIVEKIDLLAQESIQRKAAGIEAWKQSPLNKLYIAIGNKSFNDAIPVEQAIAQMEQAGERVLTQDEFHAIADMNKQLRF